LYPIGNNEAISYLAKDARDPGADDPLRGRRRRRRADASFDAFEIVRPRSLNASSRWRSPLVVTYLASLLAWAIPSGSADMSGLVCAQFARNFAVIVRPDLTALLLRQPKRRAEAVRRLQSENPRLGIAG
jgi:hypothetical protein